LKVRAKKAALHNVLTAKNLITLIVGKETSNPLENVLTAFAHLLQGVQVLRVNRPQRRVLPQQVGPMKKKMSPPPNKKDKVWKRVNRKQEGREIAIITL
jgi:hypothetical protein